MPDKPQPAAQLSVNNVKKVWGAPTEETKTNPAQEQVQKHVESHYQGSGNLNKQTQPTSFGGTNPTAAKPATESK